PPTGDGGDPVDAANSIWAQLHSDVTPPSVGDEGESKPDSSDPGLPGDSFGAPPPTPEDIADPVAQAENVVLSDFVTLSAERDDYLLQLQRLKADFDNYRKRVIKQQGEQVERAAEGLVSKLLEVLDTFDLALAHGEGFDQVHGALFGVLEKEGLERLDPAGEPFDPNESDAVAHEEGDGGPVVSDVLRAGYRWKGRVLRPAMVKVRG
nr:nucleotide exchange factor GrpE [Actinomycetota bacterium]